MFEVIDKILQLGCGTSLAEATSSERFNELLNEQHALHDRFPDGTDQGLALRAGHLLMGQLLNSVSEDEALRLAQNANPSFGCGQEMRALIQLTGEHLIAAADDCLTDKLKSLAREWRTADPERQIAIANELYVELRHTDQEMDPSQDLTMASAFEDVERDLLNNTGDSEKVLPRQYGLWDRVNKHLANCQGKTQMLTAFAKRAGCEFYCVHPIRQSKDIIDEWRQEIKNLIREDIYDRGIVFPDEGFMESLMADNYRSLIMRIRGESHHVCGILKLRDGRFVMVDPHALCWGVLSPAYKMDERLALLNKYAPVLPGLSILCDAFHTWGAIKAKEMARVQDLIQRSRNLEVALKDCDDPMSLCEALAESDELSFVMEQNFLVQGRIEEAEEISQAPPEFRMMMAMRLLFGANFPSPGELFRAFEDPCFMDKRRGMLYTMHHFIIINGLKEQLLDSGALPHPNFELSPAVFSIALSAINTVRDDRDRLTRRMLMDYSFDQVTLGNAVLGINYEEEIDHQQARAAATALRALPIRHSRCDRVLKMLGFLRGDR